MRPTARETIALVVEDLIACSGHKRISDRVLTWLFSIEFQVLYLHRLIRFFSGRRGFGLIVAVLRYRQRVISGCYISPVAEIGRKCRFPHPVGIVIGQDAKIGHRVTIFQHVTLGSHGRKGELQSYPIIEDDVTLYAGSCVLGGVLVGTGAIVGAGAIVLTDVAPHTTVVGAPARPVRKVHSWPENINQAGCNDCLSYGTPTNSPLSGVQ